MMTFHLIQDSMWAYILGAAVFIFIVGMIVAGVKGKMTDGFLMGGVLAIFICCAGSLIFFYQNNVHNNASFSKQLMDEYHVSSKRPFTAIQADLYRDQEAKDVLIRDGQETTVYIKQVSREGNKFELDFIRIDGGLPYFRAAE